MKVLQIGKWYPSEGGMEKARDNITYTLSSWGVQCDMLCESRSHTGNTYKINENCTVFVVGTTFFISRVPVCLKEISLLRKICKQYDILDFHQPNPISVLALMLSGYKGKVVTHWHADIAESFFLLKLYKPIQNWLLRHSDVIFASTPAIVETSPGLKGYENKIEIVPYGIDDPIPQPELVKEIRSEYPNKKIIFGMGRLAAYKGYDYLIDAMQELPEEYVCLIGGKGPLHDQLQSKIQSLGLEERVKLLGFLDDEHVSAYHDASILFCMPSINNGESFGIVQTEAMAHGKPVVTTKVPMSGVSWVNADGVSGLNVPVMDSHALAEAILKIGEDDALREKYGKNARERFISLFDKNVMVKSVLNVYNRLVGNSAN